MKARRAGNPVQVNGSGKTAQSYIAGIGASGALLAGAVVTFVFLVGAVSFEVWPTAAGQLDDDSLGVAELSGPGSDSSATSLGEAVSLLAAAVPSDVTPAPKGSGGLKGGGQSDEAGGGGTDQGSTGVPVDGSDGSIADTPDDPSPGDNGGSGGPTNGPGKGNNGPGRDTGNTGSNGGGAPTTAPSGSTGSGSSGGGSGSSGSGGGGSNHSSR